MLLNNTSQDY